MQEREDALALRLSDFEKRTLKKWIKQLLDLTVLDSRRKKYHEKIILNFKYKTNTSYT